MPTAQNLLPELKTACHNLHWRSETESPIQVVEWPVKNPDFSLEALIASGGYDSNVPVRVTDIESLFKPVTADRAWYDSTERQLVERYRNRKDLLETSLDKLQVYRIGEVEIDIYAVGYTEDSRVLGIQTQAVET